MEPLDPTKNDEGSGFSKHRISSILKVPHKSTRFSESEQQEYTVESVKPVEKRISKRVSFASANDVLLFSKDVRNSSPVRGLFQDLTASAAATTQNRLQMMVTEDGNQQITGMETLLNAPLHALQQKDKTNFNTGNHFGEKTLMFNTDDAFMDMTTSHTINIANDSLLLEDTLHQNDEVLPAYGEKTLTSPEADGYMDKTLNHTLNMMCSTGRNIDLSAEKNRSSAVPEMDLGFKNFLASLSKQSVPSVTPVITRISPISGPSSEKTGATDAPLARLKTQSAVLDKENQAPASVSTVRDKSRNTTKKFGDFFNRSAVSPDNNMSMDITEAQTGCIMGFTNEDNPFQCLFPTQEMYAESEKRRLHTADNLKTSKQESRRTLVSSTVRAPASTEKRVQKGIADDRSWQIADEKSLIHPSLQTSHQRPEVNLNVEDRGPEKTIVFSTDDAFMDMTQSQTINISSVPFAPSSQHVDMLLTGGKKEKALPLEQRRSMAGGTSGNHLDPGFKNLFTSLSIPGGSIGHPVTTTKFPTAGLSSKKDGKTDVSLSQIKSSNATICFEGDVSMDMTEAQTGLIMGFTDPDDPFQSLFPTQDMYETRQKNNDTLGSSNHKGSETSFKASLKTNARNPQVKFDSEEDCRDRTVRFTAEDACMDVTQSCTVNIVADFEPQAQEKINFLPTFEEKTVRFNANDANMEVTRSHTTNIDTDLLLHSHQDLDFTPACRDKTVRFNVNDAAMDMTQCLTVNIDSNLGMSSSSSSTAVNTSSSLIHNQAPSGMSVFGKKTIQTTNEVISPDDDDDVRMEINEAQTGHILGVTGSDDPLQCKKEEVVSHQQRIGLGSSSTRGMDSILRPPLQTKMQKYQVKSDAEEDLRERTVRFTFEEACMDVTRSHTVNIATGCELQTKQNVDFLPSVGDKTLKFNADDACMNVTKSHTVNIATDFEPQSQENFNQNFTSSDMTQADSDLLPTNPNPTKNRQHVTSAVQRSSLGHSMDPTFKTILSRTSGLSVNPVVKAVDTPSSADDTKGSLGHFQMQKTHMDTENKLSGLVSDVKPVNEIMKNDETLNKSVHCQEDDVSMEMTEAQTAHILGHTFTEDPSQSPLVKESHPNADVATSPDGSKASQPNDVEFNNLPNSLDSEETRTDHEERNKTSALPKKSNSPAGEVPSRKSRRMSLADILPIVRRVSQMINPAPDDIAVEKSTPHMSQLEENLCENSDKTKSLSEVEPELKVDVRMSGNITQAPPTVTKEEPPSTSATPFNLKTKQLMSRLSVGGFKPKLPRKSKPDSKKADSKGGHRKTITVNVPNHLSTFDHEVSDIYDEELESYEDTSGTLDVRSPQKDGEKPQEFKVHVEFGDGVCDDVFLSADVGKKRPVREDENSKGSEKRMKQSEDVADRGIQSAVECDSNITAATSILPNDSSTSGHTASIGCKSTSESTCKQSLFESQLEDYTSDIQMKFDDARLTVLEFFQLFNIHFVIHYPRQSVLPGRPWSDTNCAPMDLLKDRHINHPKQLVYEANVKSLTEQVEGLKFRMQDLDKPLKIVNKSLWEEMAKFSETELKAFGAKLKERNSLFRKMSKVQSHEMKEVLYSDLVQVNLEEQNKLRANIEKADEMIKDLDDCIQQVQTDLAAVDHEVKSHQEGLKKVTEALTHNDTKISELEMQMKQNVSKVDRMKGETKTFESHITTLNMVNEWKLGEKKDNCHVYTFLYDTLHLELVYDKSNGNGAENESELNIANISLKHQLDDEKSQFHAHLVHRLVSQYTAGETDWVQRYPTRKHVPQLLHDVSLVVGRCRMLGEELHRLKLWGSLRFDILDISCTGTEVLIVFSSLKTFSKFEVVFSISLINHVCVLQVQSFRSIIGCTTVEQIKEIVGSFTPGNNVLTKIVKNIHSNLLC